MSSTYKTTNFIQPSTFEFSKQNLKKAQEILKKYPPQNIRSAVMPLLYLAQEQNDNWIPNAAMDYIANLLQITPMHVYEVAHFYTMFNKQPVGEYMIQVCRTTPCWLRGSDNIKNACEKKLGITCGQTTTDKKFTLVEVECLGACVNSPVVQVNNDYYEDLNQETMEKILDSLINGKKTKIGSQSGRLNSAPQGTITNSSSNKKKSS
jgi:NADH-quinone oxidoreductase subunit E